MSSWLPEITSISGCSVSFCCGMGECTSSRHSLDSVDSFFHTPKWRHLKEVHDIVVAVSWYSGVDGWHSPRSSEKSRLFLVKSQKWEHNCSEENKLIFDQNKRRNDKMKLQNGRFDESFWLKLADDHTRVEKGKISIQVDLKNYIMNKVRIEWQIHSALAAVRVLAQCAGAWRLWEPAWIDGESGCLADGVYLKRGSRWDAVSARDVVESDSCSRNWRWNRIWGGGLCSRLRGLRQKETSGCNGLGRQTSGGTQLECTNY